MKTVSSPKIEPILMPDFPKLLNPGTYAADWYEHGARPDLGAVEADGP
jgi:hypothetical protein